MFERDHPTGCGADPNGAPGEVSCWCKDPASLAKPTQLPIVPSGGAQTFNTSLQSDTNLDGVTDQEWYSLPGKNGGSDQIRSYQLHPDLYRFDWEDLNTFGNGDFNDFVAVLEARTCGSLPYPVHAQNGEVPLNCPGDCPQDACPPTTLTTGDIKFHVAVGVDSLVTEFDREARDRTIQVTVSTYVSDAQAGRRFAVCPILWFSPIAPGTLGADDVERVVYGKDPGLTCSNWNSDTSGAPACGFLDPPNPSGVIPISLAREQEYARDSCSTPPLGGGDVFELPGNSLVCKGSWGAHVETYELALSEVDASLSSSNDQFSASTETEILNRLKYVGLSVIQDVPGDFHCPSGVNVWMHAVNDSLGVDTNYSMPNPSFNLATYVRK